MKITEIRTFEEANKLYEQSALTWEGLRIDDENLNDMKGWLESKGVDCSGLEIYYITGFTMNKIYNLNGNNAYPDRLTIVSILGVNTAKVITSRFEVGGRWFDDIVDNNNRREGR